MFKENDICKLFDLFIGQQKNINGSRLETLRGYRSVFDTLRKLMPEVKATKDFNPGNINEFFSRLQTRERIIGRDQKRVGVKKSTVFSYRVKLNLFAKWLITMGYLNENPFDQVVKASQPIYDDDRALTGEEVNQILTALISYPEKNDIARKRDLLMFRLLMFCGLRKNEIRQLQVRDVDLDKKILTVRGETSKSKRTKQLPIHSLVAISLKDYIKERNDKGYKTPFLLVSSLEDKGLSEGGLKHWTERLEKISGLDFHLHQFRHTFATNLAKANVNIAKIQKLLGHTDVKMTQRYLRSLGVEDLRSDVENLSIDGML